MYRISVITLALKKYNATLIIFELEFLDFPMILMKNDKTPMIFSGLECHLSYLMPLDNTSSQFENHCYF